VQSSTQGYAGEKLSPQSRTSRCAGCVGWIADFKAGRCNSHPHATQGAETSRGGEEGRAAADQALTSPEGKEAVAKRKGERQTGPRCARPTEIGAAEGELALEGRPRGLRPGSRWRSRIVQRSRVGMRRRAGPAGPCCHQQGQAHPVQSAAPRASTSGTHTRSSGRTTGGRSRRRRRLISSSTCTVRRCYRTAS